MIVGQDEFYVGLLVRPTAKLREKNPEVPQGVYKINRVYEDGRPYMTFTNMPMNSWVRSIEYWTPQDIHELIDLYYENRGRGCV